MCSIFANWITMLISFLCVYCFHVFFLFFFILFAFLYLSYYLYSHISILYILNITEFILQPVQLFLRCEKNKCSKNMENFLGNFRSFFNFYTLSTLAILLCIYDFHSNYEDFKWKFANFQISDFSRVIIVKSVQYRMSIRYIFIFIIIHCFDDCVWLGNTLL